MAVLFRGSLAPALRRWLLRLPGIWLVGLWVLGCAGGPPAPNGARVDPNWRDLADALRPHVAAEVERHRLPALALALVDDQKVVWAEGFGWEDKGGTRPATPETVFRVGSVSKLFTDIAVMQQVEAGTLDLDAPVDAVLPDFAPHNPFGRPITLRQLMSHRSGLVREPPVGHYFDPDQPSLQAAVASLNRTTLVYPPEERTKYSNAGIAVVGYTLERLAGEPFASLLQRRILEPLGMRSSAFAPSPQVREHLAEALMWGIDGREFPAPTFELGMAPAGSLYSTVLDLGAFLSALFAGGAGSGGQILETATLEQMMAPQFGDLDSKTAYGIGFRLSRLDGRLRIGHGGAIYGFATELAALPEERLGAVVIASRDFANPVVENLADGLLRAALAHREGSAIPLPEPAPLLADGLADRIAGRVPGRPTVAPPAPPERWRGLIGEYGWDHDVLFILEQDGVLHALIEWFVLEPLEELGADRYRFNTGLYHGEELVFARDGQGRASEALLGGAVRFARRPDGADPGKTFQITLAKPIEELRVAALAASPPVETGDFLKPDLVEVATLYPTIRLDVRYATTNNFMGVPFYEQARVFLQRPAAESLLQAHRELAKLGYGLLLHDGYRPWHVTKMFWDATPEDKRIFVADPARGSRHNRGCAIDLTLYDFETGEVVEMPGGYDEMTERSYPNYPGGSSRQRWLREVLRAAMERHDFAVYEFEWWHFDYRDWPRYPILDLRFEELGGSVVSIH